MVKKPAQKRFTLKKKTQVKRKVSHTQKPAVTQASPAEPATVPQPQVVVTTAQAAAPAPVQPVVPAQPEQVQTAVTAQNAPAPTQPVQAATQTPAAPSPETLVDATEAPAEKTETSGDSEFDIEDEPKDKKNMWMIIFFILFLCGFSVGGFFLFQKYQRQQEAAKQAAVTPTPAPTNTPTPEEVDLSQYTIDVLNGSGIAGEARKVGDALESAGFTTGTIGNASSSNAKETVITAKEGVDKEFLKKLQETLESQDHKATISAETLSDSSDADVRVVVGRDE